jgi:DnaJ-class molecular chaperone
MYDQYGEDGLGKGDSGDIFSRIFQHGPSKPQKRKTKDIMHVLPVSLEQMYTGKTKKMAVRREVVDQLHGVDRCTACNGTGSKVEVVRMGSMVQQMSTACSSCEATGRIFKRKQSKEQFEVHIQKGAVDGDKVVIREKSDELPGADTGDLIFVLKQQEHKEFQRKGADLYIERRISLVEALCGFELEVTHLDGRKLLIKSAPGAVVKPMPHGFDPLRTGHDCQAWQKIESADCPSIQSVAEAGMSDADALKAACEGQLKKRGLNVTAFVIDENSGRTYFKEGSRDEILAAKQPKQQCTMYVVGDPSAESSSRMVKAVKGEGMPTLKNPFAHGNLFIILNIEFPEAISPKAQDQLREILPPPIHTPMSIDDDEVYTLTDMDPVESHASNKTNMSASGEAYDEDEERSMPGQPQCRQM